MRRFKILIVTILTLIGLQSSAQIDVTYCRTHWWFSPEAVYISGSVTTHFKPCAEAIGSIDFDLSKHLRVDSVTQRNSHLTFTHKANKLVITLPANVAAGSTDSVTVYYHGKPVPTCFGSVGFDKETNSAWTLSQPHGGRDWWPCRQNLTDKIDSMDIYVTCPAKYKVASNGVLTGYSKNGEQHTAHYRLRHPANFYTIGIAVGIYNTTESNTLLATGDTVKLIDYYWPTAQYDGKTLIHIANFINFFSDYWIPYPYADEKYGQITVKSNASIEHQTIAFLSYTDIGVMAHELTHQWFGNYVTCKGWRNLWLNEAFATFGELLIIEKYYSDLAIEWRKYIHKSALMAKKSIYAINDTAITNSLFDVDTRYNKSAMTLVMLRNEIGHEAFQKGSRMILERYANGFASIDDARQCFEQAADTSLTDFFNSWIYGIGHPIYTIKHSKTVDGKTTITIRQNTSHTSVDFYSLHVTIRLSGEGQQKDVTLHHTQQVQQFVVETDFNVEDVLFDPECEILCKCNYR